MNGEDPPGSNSVDKIAAILTLCDKLGGLDRVVNFAVSHFGVSAIVLAKLTTGDDKAGEPGGVGGGGSTDLGEQAHPALLT